LIIFSFAPLLAASHSGGNFRTAPTISAAMDVLFAVDDGGWTARAMVDPPRRDDDDDDVAVDDDRPVDGAAAETTRAVDDIGGGVGGGVASRGGE
jgi:hypothetical protein